MFYTFRCMINMQMTVLISISRSFISTGFPRKLKSGVVPCYQHVHPHTRGDLRGKSVAVIGGVYLYTSFLVKFLDSDQTNLQLIFISLANLLYSYSILSQMLSLLSLAVAFRNIYL